MREEKHTNHSKNNNNNNQSLLVMGFEMKNKTAFASISPNTFITINYNSSDDLFSSKTKIPGKCCTHDTVCNISNAVWVVIL